MITEKCSHKWFYGDILYCNSCSMPMRDSVICGDCGETKYKVSGYFCRGTNPMTDEEIISVGFQL